MKNPQFIITPEMLEKCQQFATDSIGTNAKKYARRNQFDTDKIKQDITTGKLAELGVWQKVSELLPDLSEPDFAIYQKKDKNWSADLQSPSGIRVGVKSQVIQSEINYGRSWVFQCRMGASYDIDTGIFGNADPNHYVCFVSLNVPKKIGELRAIVKVNWLHQKKLFKAMKLAKLQNNKVAVYWEDLEKLGDELLQLK